MKYTWFLFLGLLVAGGAIAFMGDRLGRYMGKRRMTIFGLRPRKTALLFTVVAGMLISVTSLVTMSLVSGYIYKAVFEVEDLLRDRDRLKTDGITLGKQNEELVRETRRLQADYNQSKAQARKAEAQEKQSKEQLRRTLDHLTLARREAEQRVAALQREIGERNRVAARKSEEIAHLGRRIGRVRRDLDAARAGLTDAKKRHQALKAAYDETAAGVDRVLGDLGATESLLSAARSSLTTKRQELADARAQRDELRATVDGLRSDVDKAQGQITALEKAKADLEGAQKELVASRDQLQAQVAGLRLEKEQIVKRASEAVTETFIATSRPLRTGRIVFTAGQELAWDVIDGREPRARIRARVAGLVERARAAALTQGAGIKDRPDLSLSLMWLGQAGGAAQAAPVFDEQAILAVTEAIGRTNANMAAQVLAVTNTVADEAVFCQIEVHVNRLAFHQGETIAEKVISPRQPVARLLEELVGLLQGEVRSIAVQRGMIPRRGAAGTGDALQFGEMPLADLVATVEQLRKQRGDARVMAVTASDLWTADPMRVSFRVVPATPVEAGRPRGGGIGAVR